MKKPMSDCPNTLLKKPAATFTPTSATESDAAATSCPAVLYQGSYPNASSASPVNAIAPIPTITATGTCLKISGD